MSTTEVSEPADARIYREDLDAQGRVCREGYYATDGRTLYLMPPTAELQTEGAHVLRLATADEVSGGGCVPAQLEHIANAEG